jgi:hypothetical protein
VTAVHPRLCSQLSGLRLRQSCRRLSNRSILRIQRQYVRIAALKSARTVRFSPRKRCPVRTTGASLSRRATSQSPQTPPLILLPSFESARRSVYHANLFVKSTQTFCNASQIERASPTSPQGTDRLLSKCLANIFCKEASRKGFQGFSSCQICFHRQASVSNRHPNEAWDYTQRKAWLHGRASLKGRGGPMGGRQLDSFKRE